MFSIKELIKFVAAVIFPNIGTIWGKRIVFDNLDPWYRSLIQPTWNPPAWVFGPVWTTIYCSIGIASYLVYREVTISAEGRDRSARSALILYVVQMAFNWAWVPIFFGLHSLKWSFIEGLALLGTAAACGCAFYRINRVAGCIFIPYVVWLVYASCLNYKLYSLNP